MDSKWAQWTWKSTKSSGPGHRTRTQVLMNQVQRKCSRDSTKYPLMEPFSWVYVCFYMDKDDLK